MLSFPTVFQRKKVKLFTWLIFVCVVFSLILTFMLLNDVHLPFLPDQTNKTEQFHPKNIFPIVDIHRKLVVEKTVNAFDARAVNDKENFVEFMNHQNLSRSEESVVTSPCYDVHAFYYPWYGNPEFDGNYFHWNHAYIPHWNKKEAQKWPSGRHKPPHDIGSNFYPSLGAYSSADPNTVDQHMQMMKKAKIGVVAVSWYPPGDADTEGKQPDSLMPLLLDTAHKHSLKVSIHVEPYKGRNHTSWKQNLKYILQKYGDHPAMYKKMIRNKLLPLFYIYDSYLTKNEDWSKIFKADSPETVRNTELDGIFIGLVVEEKHATELAEAHFDGFYTYFATNQFTYGSSWKNWGHLSSIAKLHDMLFIPSVGPGYIDTEVRPWNVQNTRTRKNGKYYDESFGNALKNAPHIVSITSFNEWHEGTQIEPAVEKSIKGRRYADYTPNDPDFYLTKTKQWIDKFMKQNEK